MPLPPAKRLPGLLLALLTVLCWASAFPAIRIAVRGFAPAEIAFFRALMATLALGVLGLVRGIGLPRWRDVPALAFLGVVGHSLYTAVLSRGQAHVPAAMASFLIASAPVWMVLVGRAAGMARITPWTAVGMGISLGGVLVITLGRAGTLSLDAHALIVVAAAVLQAVYSTGQRPLLARYSGLQVVTWSVFFALLAFLPFGASAFARIPQAGSGPLLSALFLGLVPTALGYWTWAEANRRLPVEVAGSFLYLVPGVVLVLAWLILGERISGLSLAGGALVLGGVVVVQRFPQGRSASTSRASSEGVLTAIRR